MSRFQLLSDERLALVLTRSVMFSCWAMRLLPGAIGHIDVELATAEQAIAGSESVTAAASRAEGAAEPDRSPSTSS